MKRIKQHVPAEQKDLRVHPGTAPKENPPGGVRVIEIDAELEIIHQIQKDIVKPYSVDKSHKAFHEYFVIANNELEKSKKDAAIRYIKSIREDAQRKRMERNREYFIYSTVVVGVLVLFTFFNLIDYTKIFSPQTKQAPVAFTAPAADVQLENIVTGISAVINTLSESTPKVRAPYIVKSKPVSVPAAAALTPAPIAPIPFYSFTAEMINGIARFKWMDSEQSPATYLLEGSENGTDFQILSVVDGTPSKETHTFLAQDGNPTQFYRLVKIVHGGNVYHSSVIDLFPVAREKNIENEVIDDVSQIAVKNI